MSDIIRTFIAVDVPETTLSKLSRLQQSLAPQAPGVRWVEPEQLHLTLAFLGDLPHADIDTVCRAVGVATQELPRFELRVEGLGVFPTPNRPRVLWAGVVGPALEELTRLQAAIVAAVRAEGYPPTDDRFHPHITLGRIKGGRGPTQDFSPLLRRHQSWSGGDLPIQEVVTFSSTLTREGPIHARLATARLKGPTEVEPEHPRGH